MMKMTRPAKQGLRPGLALGSFTLLLAGLLSGCGAENAKPVANPNPTAVPVQGMSQQDYAKEMMNKASQMGRPGGGGMPGGAPGMAPGGPPGAPGMPPGAPGAPPPGPPGAPH